MKRIMPIMEEETRKMYPFVEEERMKRIMPIMEEETGRMYPFVEEEIMKRKIQIMEEEEMKIKLEKSKSVDGNYLKNVSDSSFGPVNVNVSYDDNLPMSINNYDNKIDISKYLFDNGFSN
jgi:hypothetical protein